MSIRKKTAGAIMSICLACILTVSCADSSSSKGYKESTVFAMDASCTARVWGAQPGQVTDEIIRLDKELDCHNSNSALSKLNSSGKGELSKDLKEFLEASAALTEKYPSGDITIGAVTKLWDVTGESPAVPSEGEIQKALDTCGIENIRISGDSCTLENKAQIDPGAAAKGYALDKAREKLKELNAQCAVVSMGSSTLLYGQKPDGKDFSVAVKDPENEGNYALRFTCGECFVSTSGGYERFFESVGKRYIHIFDKTTGKPVQSDLASVTVICENGLMSDQLSTCIFIDGKAKLKEYMQKPGIDVIAIDEKGNIYASDGIKDKITIENKSCSFGQL